MEFSLGLGLAAVFRVWIGVLLWGGAVICVGGDRRDFTLGLGPVAVFRVWIGLDFTAVSLLGYR